MSVQVDMKHTNSSSANGHSLSLGIMQNSTGSLTRQEIIYFGKYITELKYVQDLEKLNSVRTRQYSTL